MLAILPLNPRLYLIDVPLELGAVAAKIDLDPIGVLSPGQNRLYAVLLAFERGVGGYWRPAAIRRPATDTGCRPADGPGTGRGWVD